MPQHLAFSFLAGILLSAAALLLALRAMPARSSVRILSKVYRGPPTYIVLLSTLLVSISGALLAARSERQEIATTDDGATVSFEQPINDIGQSIDDTDQRAQAIANLRIYADGLRSKMAAADRNSADLPDVETMISRLAARLEGNRQDVDGWRMLGWSYLHTARYDEAVKAFEIALSIDPANSDVASSLAEARAQTAAPAFSRPLAHKPADASAEDMPNNPMVRDMVERLSARLETSPVDADGWMRLIQSRVVLGQTDQARDALRRALASFQNDTSARDQITAFARPLGIQAYPAN